MSIKAGDDLPVVDLFEGTPANKVSSSQFKTGKVVVFGVPGAFTPTCSGDHVPGFLGKVDELKKKGVNNVYCVSVNDPFVMAAWGKSLDPEGKIHFLADTQAKFATELGLTVDLTAVLGGLRSKRYAMVVEDGKVKGINVEPDGTGLTCSRGADILKLL